MDERIGELTLEFTGEDLSELSNESGGHRIQRVPPTERKGRVHTSTVTVVVLDPTEIKTVTWNDKDFKIEWYSGTGCGGQHRNKHQNSCRLTHITSGIVVTSQCRSRQTSFDEAKQVMLGRLNKGTQISIQQSEAILRKELAGTGMRGDKIRTYMFQHGKVTDHITGKVAPVDKIMAGNFNLIW